MIGFGYHDTMETSRVLFEDLPSLRDFVSLNRDKVSQWRLGFESSARAQASPGFFACLTPYGMQRMEGEFINVIQRMEIFNLKLVQAICQSPLPDAVVMNLIDNGIARRLELEEGPLPTFKLLYYSRHDGGTYWGRMRVECENGGWFDVYDNALQVLDGHPRVTMVPPEERVIPSKEMYL